jgi:hypothetical protein
MSLISWNCQGLGNPRTVRDLSQMVKEKKPSFLFLMETISTRRRMEWIRIKIGYAGVFAVDPVGRSGGVALLWKEDQDLEIQNYSQRHINAVVKRRGDGFSWKLTGFYGDPDSSKRKESWALLKHLKSFEPEPWLCVGDFNEITQQGETTGEVRRRERHMEEFRLALEECSLGDLGFNELRFTWSNKRADGVVTQVRLDKAVANSKWCDIYRETEVFILTARASDHNPLLINFEKEIHLCGGGNRGFKFEDRWWLDEDCGNIIRSAWEQSSLPGGPMQAVRSNLERCQTLLKSWNRRKYGNMEKMVNRKSKELLHLQQQEGNGVQEKIKKLQLEIDQLLEHEDIRWKQRAKQHWYQKGDRNTPFFHAWASHRRRINQIKKVRDDGDREWTKPEEIGQAFVNFYQTLFQSEGTVGVEECLEGLEARVTPEMNGWLLR